MSAATITPPATTTTTQAQATTPHPQARARATTTPSISAQNKAATALLRARVRRWNATPHTSLPPAAQNIPLARITPIIAQNGTILREANVDAANWDDPDDKSVHRKTRRQIHSFRQADPLLVAQRLGTPITNIHLTAANIYRLAHETGPGYAKAAKSLAEASVHAPSPAAGPTHNQLMAMRSWLDIQAKIPKNLHQILEIIVLNHNSISYFAQQTKTPRNTATNNLIHALDKLATILDCHEPRQ